MDPQLAAKELQTLIGSGKARDVRQLLDNLTSPREIDAIRNQFPDRDPLVFSIDHGQEEIALYLLEKGFTFSLLYSYRDSECNKWCYEHHQGDRCSTEYNALDLAKVKGLEKVVTLIQDIQNGLRKPGEGLTVCPGKDSPVRSPTKSTGKVEKAVPSAELTPSLTEVSQARTKLETFGINYITKNGDTVLHETVAACDSAAMVHVCANARINVNGQNFAGDTALHIAVQRRHLAAAKALLMNGADLTHRNKLGQTPLDQSEGQSRRLLETYRCGLVAALSRGEKCAMQRIARLWPNPDAVVKPGVTALELAKMNYNKGTNHQACYNLLKDNIQTLRLVHAVLSEDIEEVKKIVQSQHSWNVNVRYKDKHGETPLSCAIDQHCLELVEILLGTGKCHTNIRVRETSLTDTTVPLYFKTLEYSSQETIWRQFFNNAEFVSLTDRDCHGNTSLLRAIVNGKSSSFIQMLLASSGGRDIPYRNSEGLHARELALILDKHDVVETIDQYICEHAKLFLMSLPVAFYGRDHLEITDKQGKSLLDIAVEKGATQDMMAVQQYANIEGLGKQLFEAAKTGHLEEAAKLNTASYMDKNGYTALILAIVFNQARVAEVLMTTRPTLCGLPDNFGRLPLHYAYALPEQEGQVFIKMLLERVGGQETMEHVTDKDGREPAEFQKIRNTPEVLRMLHDARTTDPYGKLK